MKSLFPHLARENVIKSIDFLSEIYVQNLRTIENVDVFDKFIRILQKCVKIVIFNYSSCVISFYLSPLIIYYATGSIDPIMPLFLPGTSPDTHLGYGISTCYHLFAIFYAGCVYIFYDVLFAVQVLHVILMTNLFRHKIRGINRMASIKQPSRLEIVLNFRNAMMLHNEILM